MGKITDFQCIFCLKYYKNYHSLYQHKRRYHNDKICKKSQLTNNKIKSTNNDYNILYSECEFCKKQFSRSDNLKRHKEICKQRKLYNIKINKEEEIKNEVRELRIQLMELMNNQCKMHYKTFQKMQKQLINNGVITTNYNNINNQQINITVSPLGLEEIGAVLTDKQQQEVINKKKNSILHLIKMVHFNDNFPQFKNIIITNRRDNYGYIFDKEYGKFILTDKTEMLNNVLEYRADDMYDLIEYQRDNMSKEILAATSKYVDKIMESDDIKKEYLQEIHNLVYNYSDKKLLNY
jgi:hypothetical protein